MHLRCRCSVKFSLSWRDGDSNRFLSSWRGIPNTNPINLISGFLGSPLVQLRNRGSTQRRTLRESTLPGGQSHLLDLRQWLPAHPYYLQSAHFHFSASGLSWATRLRGRNELSGQLSDRHAFNMTWGCTTNWSLTDTDGDRSTPKTSLPCCFSIDIPPGLHSLLIHGYFHDSKYSQPWLDITLTCRW